MFAVLTTLRRGPGYIGSLTREAESRRCSHLGLRASTPVRSPPISTGPGKGGGLTPIGGFLSVSNRPPLLSIPYAPEQGAARMRIAATPPVIASTISVNEGGVR